MKIKTVLITGGNGGIANGIGDILRLKYSRILLPTKQELNIINEKNVCQYMKKYKPDILINCAGYIKPASILTSSVSDFTKHLEVNLIGTFSCIKYAIMHNCKTIINIGSTSAFEGRANWGAYCASKAAIISLTETLTAEGLNSYSINPARTATKMRKELFPTEDKTTLMQPKRMGKFVLKLLNNKYKNGSHIVLAKDYYYVIPKRTGVK